MSEADIQRIFVNNQTVHERNTSLVNSNGLQTGWLRTCYEPSLEAKYDSLKRAAGAGVSDYSKVLDDSTRYNFENKNEDSWRRVLNRMPGITDLSGLVDMDGDGNNLYYKTGQNDMGMTSQAEEEDGDCRDLALAELKIQAGIYLLDREAIESGLIKDLWLDEHGNAIWENRLDPLTSDMEALAGALIGTTSLIELTGYNGSRGALIES